MQHSRLAPHCAVHCIRNEEEDLDLGRRARTRTRWRPLRRIALAMIIVARVLCKRLFATVIGPEELDLHPEAHQPEEVQDQQGCNANHETAPEARGE